MLNIIKEKIKNKDGLIEIENSNGDKEIKKASELDKLTDPQWSKTYSDYQDEINEIENNYQKRIIQIDKNSKLSDNEKRIEKRKASRERDEEMIPISEKLKSTRKILNPDFEKNKKIKFKSFIKDDYNCILKRGKNKGSTNPGDYDLELKPKEQKLQEAKEKYKKIYSYFFQSKYPSVLVDKDKQNELSLLLKDIDNCKNIEDIKKITI